MLNIKKLFAEFSCKKSRAQAKSMGAVKLWADHLSVAVLFQGSRSASEPQALGIEEFWCDCHGNILQDERRPHPLILLCLCI
ncbi:guanine nucleotide-binding protein G(I)/G(S)/G(O) subunit gamma-2 isoform X4 [Bubalus kerabau]|uniref:guanine nucleotide-binding protein G(I)/G(S)/G(O) subunit gamma-2 isoform X4 n=1 Tax=Bubalus carabanensis TaxID=3119969 RepID=UPI00244E91DE|nr:guanine nucleotide-binding protein G(I)/G(S)/G(O) subunit gamma-2 isoform X4 [Bubalus carabanensis]